MAAYTQDRERVEEGAVRLVGEAVELRLFSAHATGLEFCLFDDQGREHRLPLQRQDDQYFRGVITGVKAGQRYAFRAHGPYDQAAGHLFDAGKTLIDPLAFAVDRVFTWHDDLARFGADTAGFAPKGLISVPLAPVVRKAVVRPRFIYELQVRSFTKSHPDVPEAQRGTLAALAHPAVLEHLKKLGPDTIEIMPLMAWADERHLAAKGLRNVWGYNPYVFGAPDPRLVPGGWAEVRNTLAVLHAAGFQVVLDVVFNHTGESDLGGPTLSLRGLDNASYYRWANGQPVNDTGCGNTLATQHPAVIAMILAAQRRWIEAGIDGFRYDLATVLGRTAQGFSVQAPLLQAMAEDPIVGSALHIAEPWDIGPGGYQLSHFPAGWLEWNDRVRDDIRRFWRGDGWAGDFATRMAGSSDLFQAGRRPPSTSINFIAAHDGFTLADALTYEHRRNEANGEDNRDGNPHEISWVSGTKPRDQRALIASLFLSRGTVMLNAGDEMGRSQQGNNNAYAQDNETVWLDWRGADRELIEFTARLSRLRQSLAAYFTDQYFTGAALAGREEPDVEWRSADAGISDWAEHHDVIGLIIAPAERRERLALYFNRGHSDAALSLPGSLPGCRWASPVPTCPARGFTVIREQENGPARARIAEPEDIARLAQAAGIEPEWWEIDGTHHVVSTETKQVLLSAMGLDSRSKGQVQDGLWLLRSLRDDEDAPSVYNDPLIEKGQIFGLTAHLYALRHAGDWGIGDFRTLGEMTAAAAAMRASLLGLNPLHHMFPEDRSRVSPYQPSDRRFIDPIYIDIEALGSAKPAEAVVLNGLSHVDYQQVWRLKDDALQRCFKSFTGSTAFDAFVAEGAEALQDHGRFESRHDPSRFPYALWLQWVADSQLAEIARRSKDVGPACGLYRDMAVGCAMDGGEAWARPERYCAGVSIGAPPDPFSAQGQVWYLPPFNPLTLAREGYRPYAELIRANMRHAGLLRIDHVLGLSRQFWVPPGGNGTTGAYVRMPINKLLSVLSAESLKARCALVGEDLGTVPAGFRDRIWTRKLLSYRVLWFERQLGVFLPPETYPQSSVVCLSSHDLPPFAAWEEQASSEERGALAEALSHFTSNSGDLLSDVHEFIARTPCRIALVQVDDISEEKEPLNVPGTHLEQPNWRRRLRAASAELQGLAGWRRISEGLIRAGRLS